jgi:hypothetical protein
MSRKEIDRLLTASEYIRAGQEELSALLMGRRRQTSSAANFSPFAKKKRDHQRMKKRRRKYGGRSNSDQSSEEEYDFSLMHHRRRPPPLILGAGDNESDSSEEEEDYGGGGAISARKFPSSAAFLKPERERRLRLDRKRIDRERKEIQRLERDLQLQELYMCPVQARLERAALKARFGRRPRKLKNRKRNNARDSDQFAAEKSTDLDENPFKGVPLKRFTRPQVIGGILYRCECSRRNGLQDDCKRTLCQGRPECLTNPPMCIPSGGLGFILPTCPYCKAPYKAEYDK